LIPSPLGENVLGISIVDFNAKIDSKAKACFIFQNVKDAMIRGCRPIGQSQALLEVSGEDTENISLFNNDCTKCQQPVIIADSSGVEIFTSGNTE